MKTTISHTAIPCTRICARRQLRRVPPQVDADGDSSEDSRRAHELRRDEGDVPGEERDRDLDRRIVEPAAHLADHQPTPSPKRDATARNAPRNASPTYARRERPGDDGRDGDAVADEAGPVVDQALPFDDRDELAAGRPTVVAIAVAASGIGRRDDRAEHERGGPREIVDEVRDDRHDDGRRDHEADREQTDRPTLTVSSWSDVKKAPE